MAYWKHTFNLPTLGQQKIELHKYSEKCIALRSSSKFGKAFRKQFKEVGGKFNANLKFKDSDVNEPGWIFKMADQSLVQGILTKINNEEITPKNVKEKDDFLDVYRKLLDIVPKIPDEEHDDILICENDDYRIYAKFGECETRDNMVIYFGTSKKRMYIYKEKLN